MNSGWVLVVVLLLAVAVTLPITLKQNRIIKSYRLRRCMGAEWKARFPSAPSEDVRKFLLVFVRAFPFRQQDRLKFSPEDQIMKIYKSIYFDKHMADGLELETLQDQLKRQYGVDLGPMWKEDLTLGEVFEQTQRLPNQAL